MASGRQAWMTWEIGQVMLYAVFFFAMRDWHLLGQMAIASSKNTTKEKTETQATKPGCFKHAK
eukprot:scaffold2253_cov119-Cylindrotheca_fusiformis.AAC.21